MFSALSLTPGPLVTFIWRRERRRWVRSMWSRWRVRVVVVDVRFIHCFCFLFVKTSFFMWRYFEVTFLSLFIPYFCAYIDFCCLCVAFCFEILFCLLFSITTNYRLNNDKNHNADQIRAPGQHWVITSKYWAEARLHVCYRGVSRCNASRVTSRYLSYRNCSEPISYSHIPYLYAVLPCV